jgi:hypothetical protein
MAIGESRLVVGNLGLRIGRGEWGAKKLAILGVMFCSRCFRIELPMDPSLFCYTCGISRQGSSKQQNSNSRYEMRASEYVLNLSKEGH